jgi:hypothetical protein
VLLIEATALRYPLVLLARYDDDEKRREEKRRQEEAMGDQLKIRTLYNLFSKVPVSRR